MSKISKYHNLFVTSGFGDRLIPKTKINKKKNKNAGQGFEFHRGIDFRPNENFETYAGMSGRVTIAVDRKKEGKIIQIKNKIRDARFYSNVFHNEKLFVMPGAKVLKNDIIAIAGKTGNTNSIHIHLEIFTYSLTSDFFRELCKNIDNYFLEGENRVFFDPLQFFEYCEDHKINY